MGPSRRLVRELDALSPEHKNELAHSLREAAARDRRRLTLAEAREAIRAANVSPAWQGSILVDVGRIRRASTELVAFGGWRPEAMAVALADAALEFEADPRIVANAIARGIADGLALRS